MHDIKKINNNENYPPFPLLLSFSRIPLDIQSVPATLLCPLSLSLDYHCYC